MTLPPMRSWACSMGRMVYPSSILFSGPWSFAPEERTSKPMLYISPPATTISQMDCSAKSRRRLSRERLRCSSRQSVRSGRDTFCEDGNRRCDGYLGALLIRAAGMSGALGSRQRGDDLAVLVFAEGLQRLCGHVAQRAHREHEFCANVIAGELGDEHGIVLSHGQIPGVNLASHGLGGFAGSVESRGAVFDLGDSLRRVTQQSYVVWHGGAPPW